MYNKVTVITCCYKLQWMSIKKNTEQKYSNKTYTKKRIVAKTNSAFQ